MRVAHLYGPGGFVAQQRPRVNPGGVGCVESAQGEAIGTVEGVVLTTGLTERHIAAAD